MNSKTKFDPVNFLQEIVSIQSYSGDETTVAKHIVDTMEKIGFENAFVDAAGNSVGSRSNPHADGSIDKHVVLLGHMDTVPGDIEVRIEDGILHGRGSVDAKGPLATFVAATAGAELPAGTRVTVIGAVEEEVSSSKGARFAGEEYTADFCVIGEPSGWDGVTIGYKGIVQILYTLQQSMGHASGMHSGVPERAIEFWNQLRKYVDEFNATREKLFDQLIPVIRDFDFQSDGLQDSVKMQASVRLPSDFDHEEFTRWLSGLDAEADVKVFGYEMAFRSDRTNHLSRTFNRVLRSHDQRPKFKVKTGTCDMNVLGPKWQCPIVAYGPGDSSLDHTPNEHIVIDEYLKAIEVLRAVLEQL